MSTQRLWRTSLLWLLPRCILILYKYHTHIILVSYSYHTNIILILYKYHTHIILIVCLYRDQTNLSSHSTYEIYYAILFLFILSFLFSFLFYFSLLVPSYCIWSPSLLVTLLPFPILITLLLSFLASMFNNIRSLHILLYYTIPYHISSFYLILFYFILFHDLI